jgi:hypothetical protein
MKSREAVWARRYAVEGVGKITTKREKGCERPCGVKRATNDARPHCRTAVLDK